MSQSISQQDLFQQALSLQNEKKTDEAIVTYQKILDLGLDRDNNLTQEQASAVSQNIANLYFQKKENALSYVFNQKALFLNERNSQAADFQKQNKNLYQIASIPRDISFYENLNSMGLKYFSIEILFAILIPILFFLLKNLFQFFLDQKKSEIANEPATKFNFSNYFLIVLFVIVSAFLALKIQDTTQLKVILKSATAAVQTAPGENQATVTQAEIGTIFNVLKMSNDADFAYVQIKYPGAYSGWVKRTDLELLNSTKWPVFIDKK